MRKLLLVVVVAGPLALAAPPVSAGEENGDEEAAAEASAEEEEQSDEEPSKAELVRELLDLTNAAQSGMQVAKRMVKTFRKTRPGVPDKFWDEFEKSLSEEQFVEMLVPIYEKYYTKDELRKLIEFYESPLGRKLVKKRPKIMRESMRAGQQWGRRLGRKLQRRLQKKGYSK